ncbi:MAG: hypothetical protein WA632_12260 [Gallionella sp.]
MLVITALILCAFFTGDAIAVSDSIKEGGIGGTGSRANGSGIGGTGAPANGSGIGGTGIQAHESTSNQTLAGKVVFVVGLVEAQNLGRSDP